MHRNTFRHRLRQAARLAGDPLDDPERRLALHVALKLHRMRVSRPGHDAPGRPASSGS
jgi:DNA-binding PucR family transcriptional regulator